MGHEFSGEGTVWAYPGIDITITPELDISLFSPYKIKAEILEGLPLLPWVLVRILKYIIILFILIPFLVISVYKRVEGFH